MSKQVDERVVSMQFDNRDFEKNVSTSMSTLEKLKQSLKFDNVGKSFEKITTSAKNVNLNSLANSVETVKAKFSALDVVAITTIKNITDSAYSAGTKLIKSLSVDNISAGWEKFGEKTTAVGTLIAQGYDLETVNEQLKRLNWFTDETSYNFTDMVNNIAKFTASGKDLEESVTAMEGIASWAALSGQNATKASSAMYQLSQALGAGIMRREDYKSIQTLSMNTDEFQQKALDAAVALGTLEKVGENTYKSLRADTEAFNKYQFADHLTEDMWFTSDVMMKVFNEYSSAVDEIYEYSEEKGITASEAIEELGDKVDQFGLKAFKAGQEARTYKDAIDSVKDAVGTGWMNTFEIIFGNYEQATELWTDLANSLYEVFAGGAEQRNEILTKALGSKWNSLTEELKAYGVSAEKFQESIISTAKESGISVDKLIEKYGSLEKVLASGKISKGIIMKAIEKISGTLSTANKTIDVTTDKLEHFQTIVNRVIRGDFGNGEERIKALTDAGEDHIAIQKLVNLVWERNGYTWKDTTITIDDLSEVITDLSENELKSIGYTDEEAKKLKELAEQAKKTGTPLNELINSLEKPSGRDLLIDSFKNVFGGFTTILEKFKEAWSDIFTSDRTSKAIYTLIENINNLSKSFIVGDETADKLKRTFKGLFALLDIVTTILGGPLKIGLKIISKLLGMVDVDFLSLTATVGDSIVAFRDWLFEGNLIAKVFNKIIDTLRPFGNAIKEWVSGFKDAENVGEYFIQGLVNGFQNGIPIIWNTMIEIGKSILDSIKSYLGIHSPSTEAAKIGTNLIKGFIVGIETAVGELWSTLTTVVSKILEIVKSLDLGTILATGIGVGTFLILKQALDIVKTIANFTNQLSGVIGSAKKVLDNTSNVLTSFGKRLEKKTFSDRAEAIRDIAIAIGILAGSLYLISKIDQKRLWESVGVLAVLITILGVFSFVVSKLSSVSTSFVTASRKFESNNPAVAILAMGLSILLIAKAIEKIAVIENQNNVAGAVASILSILAVIGLLMLAYSNMPAGKSIGDMSSLSKLLLSFATTTIIVSIAIKKLGKMDPAEIDRGLYGIGILAVLIGALMVIANITGGTDLASLTYTLLSVSAVFAVMAASTKILGEMYPSDLDYGLRAVTGFAVIIAALIIFATQTTSNTELLGLSAVLQSIALAFLAMGACVAILGKMKITQLAKGVGVVAAFTGIIYLLIVSLKKYSATDLAKVGATIAAFGASMILMAVAVKIISRVKDGELLKGIGAVAVFGVLCSVLVRSLKTAGDIKWVGPTLLMFAGAMTILSIAITILSKIDTKGLIFATAAVTVIGVMMSKLVSSAKDAKGAMKELIVLTTALALISVAIGVLSFAKPKKLVAAAGSISAVIGMFSLLVLASKKASGSIGTLVVLTLAIGMIGGIIYLVAQLPVENAISASIGMSALLVSMAASLAIVSSIGPMALVGVISIAALSLVLRLIASAIKQLSDMPVDDTIGIVKALSILLLAITASCLVLAGVGAIAPAALAGVGTLIAIISAIGVFIWSVGKLMDKFPDFENFLDKGIPILNKVGSAIGSFFGNIAGSFASSASGGLSDGIVKIGKSLTAFSASILPFLSVAKKIDSESISGVKNLVESILLISSGNMLESIASWLTGKNSMEAFAKQLSLFGDSIIDFSNAIAGKIDVESVKAAAEAGSAMAELAKSLPKTGGIWQDIAGEQDISDFGKKIVAFGASLTALSTMLSVSTIDSDSIASAVDAGKTLSELTNTLPKTGGVWQSVAGEQDIADFGGKIMSFMSFMITTSNMLSNATVEFSISQLNSIISMSKKIVELQDLLPKSGGVWQSIAGEQDIADFGGKIMSFVDSLSEFATKTESIKTEKPTEVINLAKSVSDLSVQIQDVDDDALEDFGKDMVSMSKKLKDFFDNINKIKDDKITEAFNKFTAIHDSMKDFPTLETTTITSFIDYFNKVGELSVSKFIESFSSKNADVYKLGSDSIDSVISGMESKIKTIKTTATDIAKKAAKAMRDARDSFSSAGEYVIGGFVTGITSQTDIVTQAATNMANAAYEATKNKLAIHSPSKLFEHLAYFIPEGFANGIDKMSWLAKDSVVSMTDEAVSSAKSVISRIVDTINSDTQAQPTIRPVVDLSDARSGLRTLNNMFSGGESIGVLSNVRTINNMMNRRQNGDTDVISAIKDLGSRITENMGNTYSINGVSYEEGSDVSDAIRTLVRAVKIDRRS